MKKAVGIVITLLLFSVGSTLAQKIPSYSADDLNRSVSDRDTIYIVNFWATWCIPCVKELPAFDKIAAAYREKPVKVWLVSFDFKEQYPEKLSAWIRKKNLRPEVAWFNETNPTLYIPKLAPGWEGGLPATILINNRTGERSLHAKEMTFDELKEWVDRQLY